MSNVIVVGDRRKFLSCLLTLRVEVDPATQHPTDRLDPAAREWAQKVAGGGKMETVEDARYEIL